MNAQWFKYPNEIAVVFIPVGNKWHANMMGKAINLFKIFSWREGLRVMKSATKNGYRNG